MLNDIRELTYMYVPPVECRGQLTTLLTDLGCTQAEVCNIVIIIVSIK